MKEIVEFPGLWNLKIPVSKEAFRIFNLPIYWYGIILASAFLLAVLLAVKQSSKYKINSDSFIDLVLFLTPVSIIGARLYYVIFTWGDFRDNLIDIFNTRKGGMAIYGGIIAGIITTIIFAKVKKINVLKLFDFGIPYLPMAQAIGRWGNFVNQEAYGSNTALPWGMTSESIRNELARNAEKLAGLGIIVEPAKPVHPTFLYESLWNLGVFLILLWYRKNKKVQGEVLFMYLILYGVGRAWVEGLRTDSLMLGNGRVSQILSIVVAVIFAILFVVRRVKSNIPKKDEVIELGTSAYGKILKEFSIEKNATNTNTDTDTNTDTNADADTDTTENLKDNDTL
jgi:phosphatidylglycerol:prolipoprotein diacylglycerol transferase